jgi:hypothetical protein
LVAALPWSEIISQFVEGSTESLGRSKTFKTEHWIIALFDSAVILFDPIIFRAAAPMLYLLPEHFRDRSRIGVVTVGRDLFGTDLSDLILHLEERPWSWASEAMQTPENRGDRSGRESSSSSFFAPHERVLTDPVQYIRSVLRDPAETETTQAG